MTQRIGAAALVAAFVLATAGCAAAADRGTPPESGRCLAAVTGPAAASGSGSPGRTLAGGTAPGVPVDPDVLSDIALPCFDGSGPVTLTGLGRPAIVNVWASWCRPCLTELPAFQAYAERAGGSVAVVGVDTGDSHRAAASLLADRQITYPILYDEQKRLLTALGLAALPATLFVAADGTVRYVYHARALDLPMIGRLAHTYLGVAP